LKYIHTEEEAEDFSILEPRGHCHEFHIVLTPELFGTLVEFLKFYNTDHFRHAREEDFERDYFISQLVEQGEDSFMELDVWKD
tara:strand:- start:2642 stop:2890 length:249 start_codon:yes stop_codon:yes gene_type:complete